MVRAPAGARFGYLTRWGALGGAVVVNPPPGDFAVPAREMEVLPVFHRPF
jgi:hypothetical protein